MKKVVLDPKYLPYFGAIVQAVMFSIAGNEFFPSVGWLVGFGVGAVVNYSLALASSRYADVAEKRKTMALVSMVAMFLLSPVTITLSMFYPASIFTAISWSICVDLSIVLAGSIVGKGLIHTTTEKKKVKGAKGAKGASAGAKSAKASPKGASQSPKGAVAVSAVRTQYPRTCDYCDTQITSPNGVGAHMKKHHPERCKSSKSGAEVLFEPFVKDK